MYPYHQINGLRGLQKVALQGPAGIDWLPVPTTAGHLRTHWLLQPHPGGIFWFVPGGHLGLSGSGCAGKLPNAVVGASRAREDELPLLDALIHLIGDDIPKGRRLPPFIDQPGNLPLQHQVRGLLRQLPILEVAGGIVGIDFVFCCGRKRLRA